MLGARLMARRAGRPAALIAGRRLSDNPQAGFRAVSGLVLALCVGSGAIGAILTIGSAADPGGGDGSLLVDEFGDPLAAGSIANTTLDQLASIPGVEGVTVLHRPSTPATPTDVRDRPPGVSGVFSPLKVVSCAQLARTPSLGRCPDGADTVTIQPTFVGSVIEGAPSQADVVWPPADLSSDELQRLPVDTIVVANDGSTQAIEQARTLLGITFPTQFNRPETVVEMNTNQDLEQWQQLVNVVIAASLVIAGCSLAVSVAAGLRDRRRPFSLLRLTGVSLAMLRRVVALETVVPLLITAVVAAGCGFLGADLFLRAQMDRTLQAPGGDYYLVVLAGLVASLAVIASTLPLLNRITGPETARNE
jgi:hypothetical protein